ncbi:hypothetical protein SUGI_0973720 [Cryptomeria japonica]|nr:hypothetical protein SUGI_0973720 [Cryptomeria japonica]
MVYKFIRARIREWRTDGSWVWRRDRSLAGKEVMESRSEKELLRHREKRGSVRKEASMPRLPSWWPPPDIRPATSSQDSTFGQLRGNALHKGRTRDC